MNKEKQVLHFIVDRTIDGVIPMAELPCPFREGDAIAVKVSKRSTDKGTVYRVLNAESTHEKPGTQVRKEFNEAVRLSNSMGFTDSDIFIPPRWSWNANSWTVRKSPELPFSTSTRSTGVGAGRRLRLTHRLDPVSDQQARAICQC